VSVILWPILFIVSSYLLVFTIFFHCPSKIQTLCILELMFLFLAAETGKAPTEVCMLHKCYFHHTHTHTHTHTQPFYSSLDFAWDNPGELVPEGTFCHILDFLVQNEDKTGRHTNNPDGLPPHPNWLVPLSLPSHHFYARYPLTQSSQFILAWDRHQICWLPHPVACYFQKWYLTEENGKSRTETYLQNASKWCT